jgi:HEPN domain-containing protein
MENKESLYPPDWFEKAKKDLERVSRRLAENDLEDAAVHLQQAIEKYLKGYLLSKGWKLKKIHDLSVLLTEAAKYNPKLAEFLEFCQEASSYYLKERYPLPAEYLSKEEIENALSKAEELIQELLRDIK